MRPNPVFLSVLVVLFASGCAAPTLTPPPTPALVRVAVTDLTEPLAYDLARAYAEAVPSVLVAPVVVASDAISATLAGGQAELALAIDPAPGLFVTPVGYVSLQVVVHRSNPLGELGLAEAQALFTGPPADWAALGGAAGAVQPVVRGEGGDAAALFAEQALAGGVPMPGAWVAPTWDAMRELVAQNRGAVGYLPAPLLDDTIKPLRLTREGDPAAVRGLILAASTAEPAGPARDFVAWAQSAAGQAVVGERYEPYVAGR